MKPSPPSGDLAPLPLFLSRLQFIFVAPPAAAGDAIGGAVSVQVVGGELAVLFRFAAPKMETALPT